jgi:hypothetical protein
VTVIGGGWGSSGGSIGTWVRDGSPHAEASSRVAVAVWGSQADGGRVGEFTGGESGGGRGRDTPGYGSAVGASGPCARRPWVASWGSGTWSIGGGGERRA